MSAESYHEDPSRVIGVGVVAPDGTLEDRQEQPTNVTGGEEANL